VSVSAPAWQETVERVAALCQPAGFDLVRPFAADWFNAGLPERERLYDFGRPATLGILLGNTRALWPSFRRALERSASLAAAEHPLDNYTKRVLWRAASHVAPLASCTYFAHTPPPLAIPIQRLAELIGFAGLSPSRLAVHPSYGPWFALRAVLLVDIAGPDAAPPEPVRPCFGCSEPCMPAFEQALQVSTPISAETIARHAADWIAVRDACPIGRAFRYDDDQLAYHYQGDRRRLPLTI
jgi:methylmalonic aciduria homocystinuria type C protein